MTSHKLNVLIGALEAASRCDSDDIGGFSHEQLPAILAAIDLGLPLPAVKERPVEWKAMTAAGNEPGSWPHFIAHMRDIADQGTTIKKRRARIMEINDLLMSQNGNDERALRDEKFRLVRYVVFLKSLLDDIVIACRKGVDDAILEEERGATPAEKGRLTPDLILKSFEQLCGGKRDSQTRWSALQRLLEIVVRKHGEKSTFGYTDAERQAIENRLCGIATFTLRLEDQNLKGDELKMRTQAWMNQAVSKLRQDLAEFIAKSTEAPPVSSQEAPQALPSVTVSDYNGRGSYSTEAMEEASATDIKFYANRKRQGEVFPEDLVAGFIRCEIEAKLLKGQTLEDATILALESFLELLGRSLAGSDPEFAQEKMSKMQTIAHLTIDAILDEDLRLQQKGWGDLFLARIEPWFLTWTGEELKQADYPAEEDASKESSLIENLSHAATPATSETSTDGLAKQLANQVIAGVRNGSMKVEAKA